MPSNYDLTDMDGDTVRFTHPHGGHTFVTVQSTSGTACAGPFTRAQLIEALDAVTPAGNSTGPHVHHDAQGGWKRRDDYPAGGLVQALPADAAEARPLTPHEVPSEAVEQARAAWINAGGRVYPGVTLDLRHALAAVLPVAPARPDDRTPAELADALLDAIRSTLATVDPRNDTITALLRAATAAQEARRALRTPEEDPR